MQQPPILSKDLDISKITYKAPRDLTNGGRVIYMNLARGNSDGPIILQTGNMFCPFGLKDWEGNQNYTLDLSFKGSEDDPKIKNFLDKMADLDEKLLTDCVTNGVTWLKKPITSKEVASIVYTKMVKYARDKNGTVNDRYPPTFKLKVPFKDGKFVPDVYDNDQKLIDLSTIETKGSKIVAIIQCLGLWVAGGKYGCSWKILQMRVVPPVGKVFGFIELDDEPCSSQMNKMAIKDKPVGKTAKKESDDENEVEDSDDDDDLEA